MNGLGILFDRQNALVKVGIVCIVAMGVLFGLSATIMKTVISMKLFFLMVGFSSVAIVFYHIGKNNIFMNLLGLAVAFVVSAQWFLKPNWWIIDIIGICIVLQVLLGLPRITLQNLIIIAIGFVLYDVIVVYFLNTMARVAGTAMSNELPMLIMIPRTFSFAETSNIFALGLGDVMLPALLIKEEFYRAKEYDFPKVLSIPLMPLVLGVGYVIGIAIAIIVAFTTRTGQPALVFIIPAMFACLGITYFIVGQRKSCLK